MVRASLHKTIRRNKLGRDFVVGDLHGRYDLLKKAMKKHDFDKSKDRLFSVGDIINRGSQSEKCLKLLKKPWFFMVLGNHETAFIEAVSEGRVKNYARQYDDWILKLPCKDLKKWARLLSKTPTALTLKAKDYTVGICHAEPDGLSWKKSRDRRKSIPIMLMGRRALRKQLKSPVKGVDFTVHGHTPMAKAMWVGNRYFMDTGAWYSDKLTFKPLDEIYKVHNKRLKTT